MNAGNATVTEPATAPVGSLAADSPPGTRVRAGPITIRRMGMARPPTPDTHAPSTAVLSGQISIGASEGGPGRFIVVVSPADSTSSRQRRATRPVTYSCPSPCRTTRRASPHLAAAHGISRFCPAHSPSTVATSLASAHARRTPSHE